MNKLFEQLIKKRGIDEKFLHPKYEDLLDPFLLPDMEKAVDRIAQAIKSSEHILIYGDYDVDGVTASTAMEEALRLAGTKEIDIMLPDRFVDGYGMNPKVVKKAKELGATLVITVDCGSSNGEIVEALKSENIDTIVTDHHELAGELPKAVAVLNPKRKDYNGFRDLAGVGVAFKLAQALAIKKMIPFGQEKWLLDLVLIGTLCDSMPLTGDNRILSFYGVKVLGMTRRLGLKELMRRAGVTRLNAESIGFQIGPRLNAAGRLESAELSLALLRTKSIAEAAQIAERLEELNKKRKTEQRIAAEEIRKRGISHDPVLVEVGKWHEGILGIVAGKLVEEYARPAFVLTKVSDDVYKGSGRSFGEFNLAEALANCKDYILNGGGHALAAGVKVKADQIDAFRAAINDCYKSLDLKDQERFLEEGEDLVVEDLSDLSLDFFNDLELLEPFGGDNEEPIFKLENIEVGEVRLMGIEGQHLSVIVVEKTSRLKLISFFAPDDWFKIQPGDRCDILIKLMKNEWNGNESVEGRILSLSFSEKS